MQNDKFQKGIAVTLPGGSTVGVYLCEAQGWRIITETNGERAEVALGFEAADVVLAAILGHRGTENLPNIPLHDLPNASRVAHGAPETLNPDHE